MKREEFLKLADAKWTEIESLQQSDFYEFEKKFEVIMIEMGQAALEGVLGEVPKDRRKKKNCLPASGRSRLTTSTFSAKW